jgi:hypothetical protein
VQWNVGTEPVGSTNINKSSIKRVGVEVTAGGSSAWANPTIVYIDSIIVATPAFSFTFDTTGTVTSTASNGTDVAGQVMWLNSYSSDTSASGATLGWLATCP